MVGQQRSPSGARGLAGDEGCPVRWLQLDAARRVSMTDIELRLPLMTGELVWRFIHPAVRGTVTRLCPEGSACCRSHVFHTLTRPYPSASMRGSIPRPWPRRVLFLLTVASPRIWASTQEASTSPRSLPSV